MSGWQIQNATGTINTFTIQTNTKISTESFLVFKRPDTQIMMHNDGDGINLLTPDGKTEDSVNYSKAFLNQSYNKTKFGWSWSTTLTPGAANIITALAVKVSKKTVAASSTSLPKTEKPDNNNLTEAGLADVSSGPWLLFFIVLAITIILALLVLFIKVKFLNKNVRT